MYYATESVQELAEITVLPGVFQAERSRASACTRNYRPAGPRSANSRSFEKIITGEGSNTANTQTKKSNPRRPERTNIKNNVAQDQTRNNPSFRRDDQKKANTKPARLRPADVDAKDPPLWAILSTGK